MEVTKAGQWTLDTSTPLVPLSRRVYEGKAATLVQSRLPAEWWNEAMKCYCSLRNVHGALADGESVYDK